MKEAVSAILCGLSMTASIAAHAKDTGGSVTLGTFRGMQPTLEATVAGHKGTFLFDTGGGITIISPTLAKSVGCEPWGDVVGLRMTGQRIDLPHCDNIPLTLGEMTYRIPAAAVFDIMSIEGKGAPTSAGSACPGYCRGTGDHDRAGGKPFDRRGRSQPGGTHRGMRLRYPFGWCVRRRDWPYRS